MILKSRRVSDDYRISSAIVMLYWSGMLYSPGLVWCDDISRCIGEKVVSRWWCLVLVGYRVSWRVTLCVIVIYTGIIAMMLLYNISYYFSDMLDRQLDNTDIDMKIRSVEEINYHENCSRRKR